MGGRNPTRQACESALDERKALTKAAVLHHRLRQHQNRSLVPGSSVPAVWQISGSRRVASNCQRGSTLNGTMARSSTLAPSAFCSHFPRSAPPAEPAGHPGHEPDRIIALFEALPTLVLVILRARPEQEHRTDLLRAMLGHLDAAERVGRFLTGTYERLRRRGMTSGAKCPFPPA